MDRKQRDIHRATINGYRVVVFPSEQVGTWSHLISDCARIGIVNAGYSEDVEAAKKQAEQAALSHEGT